MRGSRVLATKGRKSGEWRTTPVNPLSLGGERYLLAPRGQTHWVRNIRANGEGSLRLGRKEESIRVVELADAEKVPVLRAYPKAWASETKKFFGLEKDATDADLSQIAPNHPSSG